MKKSHLLGAVCACTLTLGISATAHAAFIARDLDGNLTTTEAYYDDQQGITWTANASLNSSSGTWPNQTSWAESITLTVYGTEDWRLASTTEFTNLYQSGITSSSQSPFSNIQAGVYWSNVEFDANNAFGFNMFSGTQALEHKTLSNHFAWAVQSGDIGIAVVPVPAAAWLFGSGLFGLAGIARRKKTT